MHRRLLLHEVGRAFDVEGDALIVALMERRGSKLLYSYDTDFDRIPSVTCQEPGF